MPYLTQWQASDGSFVVIEPKALAAMIAFRQVASDDAEAGGVLLGRRRVPHLEVARATLPYPTDKRGRFSFVRESIGHQSEAITVWQDSAREIGYIGEWHTHPEKLPILSPIDAREWRYLIGVHSNELPLLGIIIGTSSLNVYQIRGGRSPCQLTPIYG